MSHINLDISNVKRVKFHGWAQKAKCPYSNSNSNSNSGCNWFNGLFTPSNENIYSSYKGKLGKLIHLLGENGEAQTWVTPKKKYGYQIITTKDNNNREGNCKNTIIERDYYEQTTFSLIKGAITNRNCIKKNEELYGVTYYTEIYKAGGDEESNDLLHVETGLILKGGEQDTKWSYMKMLNVPHGVLSMLYHTDKETITDKDNIRLLNPDKCVMPSGYRNSNFEFNEPEPTSDEDVSRYNISKTKFEKIYMGQISRQFDDSLQFSAVLDGNGTEGGILQIFSLKNSAKTVKIIDKLFFSKNGKKIGYLRNSYLKLYNRQEKCGYPQEYVYPHIQLHTLERCTKKKLRKRSKAK